MEAQVEVGVEIVDVRRVSQFRCPVKKAGISFRPNLVGIFDERQVKWSSRSEPLRITSITRSTRYFHYLTTSSCPPPHCYSRCYSKQKRSGLSIVKILILKVSPRGIEPRTYIFNRALRKVSMANRPSPSKFSGSTRRSAACFALHIIRPFALRGQEGSLHSA